jgi:elongation factor Ts
MDVIKPALVKELRERTGAGMMDCKKALVDAGGEIDAAAELLRKQGQAKADKKASRVAAEGRVVLKSDEKSGRHALVEVNSETDFVAKDDNFRAFAERVAEAVLDKRPASIEALMGVVADGRTLEESRQDLITKVGENITVRRFEIVESQGHVGAYVHGNRIGVLVDLEGGNAELARDLAMQVASLAPRYVANDDVPKEFLDKEREIILARWSKASCASSSTKSRSPVKYSSRTTRSACAICSPRTRRRSKASGVTRWARESTKKKMTSFRRSWRKPSRAVNLAAAQTVPSARRRRGIAIRGRELARVQRTAGARGSWRKARRLIVEYS